MKARMYTTPNCDYCQAALELLNTTNIPTELISIDKFTKKEVIEQFKTECPEAKTVPQIFIDNKWVGGYEDLRDINFNGSFIDEGIL